jgi:predicted lipoprotein with Yx(FWY)xxD motif
VILVVVAGGGFLFFKDYNQRTPGGYVDGDQPTQNQTPSSAAGINGAPNQGNPGNVSTDTVNTIIGGNVALGVNKSTTFGTYLVAYNGMTLYTFTKDTGTASTCYDQCAQNWPPYVVASEDNVNNVKLGVNGKIATKQRKDGSLQVTYNGRPVYFFAGDKTLGDTNGQNVGKMWFVVKP